MLSSAGIKKEGLCLVSGEKIIKELLSSSAIDCLLLNSKASDPNEITSKKQKLTSFYLANDLFNEINESNSPGPIAVVKRPSINQWGPERRSNGLEIILALQDPNNLGAALRVAEAFSVSKVILLKECCEPFLPKANRSASGSNFRIPIQQGPSLKDFNQTIIDRPDSSPLIALDVDGEDISQFQWPKNCRLFLGVEGPGIPAEFKKNKNIKKIKIKIAESVDSLNAVSALSIASYSYKNSNFK